MYISRSHIIHMSYKIEPNATTTYYPLSVLNKNTLPTIAPLHLLANIKPSLIEQWWAANTKICLEKGPSYISVSASLQRSYRRTCSSTVCRHGPKSALMPSSNELAPITPDWCRYRYPSHHTHTGLHCLESVNTLLKQVRYGFMCTFMSLQYKL